MFYRDVSEEIVSKGYKLEIACFKIPDALTTTLKEAVAGGHHDFDQDLHVHGFTLQVLLGLLEVCPKVFKPSRYEDVSGKVFDFKLNGWAGGKFGKLGIKGYIQN